MKHAYLIMAHNNFEILEKTLKLLDDTRNDLYIHIDKKVKKFNFNKYKSLIKFSNIHFVKRIDVRWSDYSQIKCELELLKEATKTHHKYYHLLSGVDIPLQSQNVIHDFFANSNKEFVHFRNHNSFDNRLERINYYHLFYRNARSSSKIKLVVSQKMHSSLLKLQKKLKITRIKPDSISDYRDGANWFSITEELANYVVSLEKEIKKKYKYTYCADEVFLQTIVYNSKFYQNLSSYKNDDYNGIKRIIDWQRGNPYSFKAKDYQEIINNDNFFVRKVEDVDLAKKIYDKVMHEK